MSDEEDDFHAALRKKSPAKAAKGALPILVAGVAGAASLPAVWYGWPFDRLPFVVLFGVPVAVAVGAFLATQKLTGTD